MKSNRQTKVEKIIIGALFLLAVMILAPIVGSFSVGGDIKKVSLNQLQEAGEVTIKWPATRGITVNLGRVVHDNYLDIHLSPFDTYKVEFNNGDDSESIYINTGVDAADDQGYQKILHLIPEYIAQSGYRKITVYPINGDGSFAISHLATANLTDPQTNSGYDDYQVVNFEIPKIEFVIREKDYQQIEEKRREALSLGFLFTDPSDYVPAKVKYDGRNYKTEIRLKGDWTDHIVEDKWSFRVEVKGGDTIMGMEEFSIQRQETRGAIWPYLIHEMYREQGGVALRYLFVDVVINGQYKGVYALEEGFTKLAVEHSLFRESPILKFNEHYFWEQRAYYNTFSKFPFWVNLEPFSQKKTLNSPGLSGYAQYGIDLLDRVVRREIPVEDAFDLEKYAKYAAILDVFATSHANIWHNMRFYTNPVTGKLEPITFDDLAFSSGNSNANPYYLFQKEQEILEQIMADDAFLALYFEEMITLSSQLDQFIERHHDQVEQYNYTIKRDNNGFDFVMDSLYLRQEKIQELYSDKGLRCYWQDDGDGYSLFIKNYNQAPTFLDDVNHAGSRLTFEQPFPQALSFKQSKTAFDTFSFTSENDLEPSDLLTLDYSLFTNDLPYTANCEKLLYSFFVAGNADGATDSNDGIHAPLLAKLPALNDNGLIKFGVFTGDFIASGSQDAYNEFFDQVQAFSKPIYAVPENHEEKGTGERLFQEYFGSKYNAKVIDGSLFLFLDPDDESWSISPEQIAFIEQELKKNKNPKNIFVFTHQLAWWEENDPRFEDVVPNSLAGKNGPGNFWTEVIPLFETHSDKTTFIAGDVGAFPNGSEYSFTKADGFTFISSGMGGNERDNLLVVYVKQNGVDFELHGLNVNTPFVPNPLDRSAPLGAE